MISFPISWTEKPRQRLHDREFPKGRDIWGLMSAVLDWAVLSRVRLGSSEQACAVAGDHRCFYFCDFSTLTWPFPC